MGSITSTKISKITIIGLVLSLAGYLIISVILDLPTLRTVLSPNNLTLLKLFLIWVLAATVITLVIYGEGRALRTIGLKPITIKETLLAIGLGILLSLSVPILTVIVSRIIPSSQEGSVTAVVMNVPAGIMLLATLTAGITEEILYRGYAIERITEITGNQWLAIFVSVATFVLVHLAAWNWTHIVAVVLPLGIVLSGIYVWKRNLILNMVVHTLIDLPLVFMALSSGQG